jgi:hypothetical protein
MATASVKSRIGRLGDGLIAICGTLFCSSVVVFLDVVLDGSYLFAAMVCPICFLVGVVRAIARGSSWGVAAARVLIPVATLLLVLANNSLQGRIAKANSAILIQACERYREANGNYPERLGDLVPRYLSSIPRAKYCLHNSDFQYISSPPPLLFWWEVPPFGRRVYRFETRDWNYVD